MYPIGRRRQDTISTIRLVVHTYIMWQSAQQVELPFHETKPSFWWYQKLQVPKLKGVTDATRAQIQYNAVCRERGGEQKVRDYQ